MRFITEMGNQSECWEVVDTADHNAIVGVHETATLAALDAYKREQDNCHEELLSVMQRQKDLSTLLQHRTAA
jgi:hypothetical protein